MPSESGSFSCAAPKISGGRVNRGEIGGRRRVLFLSIAWTAALLMTCPAPAGIMLLPFFPAGLLFGAELPNKYGDAILTCGWLLYAGLCAVILSCRKRLWFYLFYAVLVCLLLTNVVGCHQILKGLSHIH